MKVLGEGFGENPSFKKVPPDSLCGCANLLAAFSFGNIGAKEKANKKKSAERRFRALRSARRLPQPPPRRLLKKAGENFHQTDESLLFSLQSGANAKTLNSKKLFAFHRGNEASIEVPRRGRTNQKQNL